MVKSVDRIAKICSKLASSEEGLSHTELAKTLRIPKSTLTEFLGSLIQHQYIAFDPSNKTYTLGPEFLALANHYLDNLKIVKIGQPRLKQITEATGESAALYIVSRDEMLLVARFNSHQPLIRAVRVGDRIPMYASAAGRAVLAFFSPEKLEAYLESVKMIPITRKTICDPGMLRKELTEIRKRNLAYDWEGFQELATGIAAPVLDLYRRPTAALAVIVPTIRFNHKKKKLVEQTVTEHAKGLSRQMGHGGSLNAPDPMRRHVDG